MHERIVRQEPEIRITSGAVAVALEIMREAATWLKDSGKPMWHVEDITEEKILAGITADDLYVGWVGEESAAAMILRWEDPAFWPRAKDDSGFVHKLAVRRKFAGRGVARRMVDWGLGEALRRGKTYLRLDCAGDRPKLCAFYEKMGFRLVDRRTVGSLDMAFYELRLT